MGRTVSQTRRSPNAGVYPFSGRSFGNVTTGTDFITNYLTNSVVQSQTTTSYRSGKDASGGTPDELKNLDSATNELQAVQAIARDTKLYSNSYDNGHEFHTTDQYVKCSNPHFSYQNDQGNYFNGPLMQHPSFVAFRPVMPGIPAFSDLAFYGANAIRNTIPVNPLTNLATSLGEIYSDGLPKLPHFLGMVGKGFGAIKHLSEEYLNYQFGWKPTVADTAAAMNAVDQAKRVIDQYLRDNGKTIRRSFAFPQTKTTQMSLGQSNTMFDPFQAFSQSYLDTGTVTETITTTRDIWFSGAYTYYLPMGNDILSRLDRYASLAQKAIGLEITPEVLWNLAPWSWFGGWLSDVGALVHNLNAFSQDGLVLRYGYLMVKTEAIHTVTTTGMRLKYANPGTFTTVYRIVDKQRFRATPYGFGLNPNSFTSSQWSILGALGLSRNSGTLRINS